MTKRPIANHNRAFDGVVIALMMAPTVAADSGAPARPNRTYRESSWNLY